MGQIEMNITFQKSSYPDQTTSKQQQQRHIILQQMQNNQNILTHFQQLLSLEISKLSPTQMKEKLLALQNVTLNNHQAQLNRQVGKQKPLHKIFDKKMLRKQIRSKMMGDMRKRGGLLEEEGSQKGMINIKKSQEDREGKLKFNLGANLQTNSKIKNFKANIPQAMLNTSGQELICAICLQFLICPALTTCGHTFCYQCIDQSLLFMHGCPSCRQNIRGCELTMCSALDRIVRYRVQVCGGRDPDIKKHYEERMQRYEKWKNSRTIDYENVAVGQIIDVRDTQTIWCQGEIKEIIKTFDKKKNRQVTTGILIHYNRWHAIYNQVIEVPSVRFAPLAYFSSRSDILHYNLAEEEGNVRGSVTTGMRLDAAPRAAVQYIRIDQSNDEVSSSSFISAMDAIQGDENLSRLAPESPQEEEEEGRQVEEESLEGSEIGLGQFMNRMRRNVLNRVSRNSVLGRLNPRNRIGSRYFRAPTSEEDDEEESYIPPSLGNDQPVLQYQSEPLPDDFEMQQNQSYDPNIPYGEIQESYEYYEQEMNLLKDNSDQNHEMFGPEDPSNMLEEYE